MSWAAIPLTEERYFHPALAFFAMEEYEGRGYRIGMRDVLHAYDVLTAR